MLVRMATIKKSKTANLERVWRKGTLCPAGGNVSWCRHYGKTVWRFLKLQIELPSDPGHISGKEESSHLKKHIHFSVHSTSISNS